MYVFVDVRAYNDELIEELKLLDLKPVIVYSVKFEDKNKFKNEIDRAINLKKNYPHILSAIKIVVEKPNNIIVSSISYLKKLFDIVIGFGGTNNLNRFYIESTKIDFLQDPQNSFFSSKIDFIHHYNSGLNHILCKIAREKGIRFFFSLNFSSGKKINFAKELARVNQNIKFAKKYDIDIYFNFLVKDKYQLRTKKELEFISYLFNMSENQRKESINMLEKVIYEKCKINSNSYVSEGIEIIN